MAANVGVADSDLKQISACLADLTRLMSLATKIANRTVLVLVMHANNEIGTIQPLVEISAITRNRNVLLHTDAAQSLDTLPFNTESLGIDLASFSGHKVYGPKGIGALYIRHGIKRPVAGGGQEFGIRAGPPNVPGIAGFGAAAAILEHERQDEVPRIRALRDHLLTRMQAALPHVHINGAMTPPLSGNINITVPGIDADQLVSEMSGVAISTGSACGTGHGDPSHVLTTVLLGRADARATLRVNVGRYTTRNQIDEAAERLAEAVLRHTGQVSVASG